MTVHEPHLAKLIGLIESKVKMKTKHTIKVPEGRNLVEMTLEGMAKDSRTGQAAKAAGMHVENFRFIRKLLVLRDRVDVILEDKKFIIDELQIIKETNQIFETRIKFKMKEIFAKYWYPNTYNGTKIDGKKQADLNRKERKADKKTIQRQFKRLDNTLFAIRESCCNNDEMIIPQLTDEKRKEAEDVMIESMNSLWNLFHKIKEGEKS